MSDIMDYQDEQPEMTFKEVLEILKAEFRDVSEYAYDGNCTEDLRIGEGEEVHSTGGEDEGSHWSRVYHYPKINMYIEVTGWYQSHYGTDFESWEEAVRRVYPEERTITVYV